MKLGDWLALKGLSQKAFGEKIGRTQGRVSQLVRGHWPSAEEGEQIFSETAGAVTPNDWLPEADAAAMVAAGTAVQPEPAE